MLEPDRGLDGPLAGAAFTDPDHSCLNLLKRACREAGVPRVSWRGLRHTSGTLMAATQPIHVVQRWLGHSELLLQRHISEDERASADRLEVHAGLFQALPFRLGM